jgi:hypothetical protein
VLIRLLTDKFFFRLVVAFFIILQLWILNTQQLFGDEAFYWLEGQYLGLSYSELPGWTAWMIRLGVEIFGNNYFGVRIFSFLGFLSIFPGIWLLHNSLTKPNDTLALNLYMLFAIPLIALIAIMALPDIWLLTFVTWFIYFFSKAMNSQSKKYWVWIGILLAFSLNVHVRMWIWLFIAGVVFLVIYRKQKQIIQPALIIAFPITLMGLLPIIIFNYQNEFPLFQFQFGQRHPWEFQIHNLKFLLSQVLIISPLVLFLWFYNISLAMKNHSSKQFINWIVYTALFHWLLYVFLGLFADGLRTTVHWVLMSYLPVLSLSTIFVKNLKLLIWAILSGFIFTLAMLVFLTADKSTLTNTQARILDNSSGWQQLAKSVSAIQEKHNLEYIVTDYFMTAAELAFELGQKDKIKVLTHAKNIKHGREKQLDIMGMLLKNPEQYRQEALLVVEDSTLKLIDKGKYYSQLCKNFKQLNFLKTVNIDNSKKKYHFFKINNTTSREPECSIPPVFYIQHVEYAEGFIISGWVIFHEIGIKSLTLKSGENTFVINEIDGVNFGIEDLFPEILDPNLPNNGFEVSIPVTSITNNQYRLIALGNDGKNYSSQLFFIE